MGVFSGHFPLGLGTSRFPISGRNDTAGFEQSVAIVRRALELGVDYIDVAYNYSAGMALPILREALQQAQLQVSITAKIMLGQDRTADDAQRRVEFYLRQLELNKVRYFTCWCIWSYRDFEKIISKGGIYDGALHLKESGLIDHICCSLHCPPEDMVRIIESGAFEGITVSYSLLNAPRMQRVLGVAQRQRVGVAVMNPLGGGLISQNRNYFSFACGKDDNGETVRAALRFVKASPSVDIVLGGVSSVTELEDSVRALSDPDPEPPTVRTRRVLEKASDMRGFCSGCKYCEGCPQGIPTSAIMQAYNTLLFDPVVCYNRQGPRELLYNLQIFRKLFFDYDWLPTSGKNPCVQCGKCERKCTQKLPIMKSVSDIYQRARISGYTQEAHLSRLNELLYGKGYHKVGLYPSGGFSSKIIALYQDCWGEPEFEWLLFNSDKELWEKRWEGHVIYGPEEISALRPDVILVCTYKFDKEIMESLEMRYNGAVQIERLHRDGEVPWIF